MSEKLKTEELKIDIDTEIEPQSILYTLIGVAFFSLIIGAALGHSASPDDKVKTGMTELCHKFGGEAAWNTSYRGTHQDGTLTVECGIDGDTASNLEIQIPVQSPSATVTAYGDR